MKNCYLLLAYLASFCLQAQSLHPFPTEDSRWVNTYSKLQYTGGMPYLKMIHSQKFCLEKADTLIAGTRYQKLFICGDSLRYFGALSAQNQQVHFIPKDSLGPLLIYDFSLKLGDTLKEVYSVKPHDYFGADPFQWRFAPLDFGNGAPIVQQIDTLQTQQGPRRRFTFGNPSSGQWIEGVGNTQGFLWDPFPNISGFSIQLHCHSSLDTIRYPALSLPNAAGECDLDLGFEAIEQQRGSLYPNPVDDFVIFQHPTEEQLELVIYDSRGQVLQRVAKYRSGAVIATADWPSGLYLLRLKGKEAGSSHRLLVEH